MIKINPNNSKEFFYKGYILNKANYLALYNIGLILLKEERFEECKSYFTKSYEINQKFFKTLLRLGDSFFKQGQYKTALKYYDKI